MTSSRSPLSLYDLRDLQENWRGHSICGPEHDKLMYSTERRGSEEHTKAITKARQLCWQCPVRQMCLKSALESNQKFGVWGGHDFSHLDPALRNRLRLSMGIKTPTNTRRAS